MNSFSCSFRALALLTTTFEHRHTESRTAFRSATSVSTRCLPTTEEGVGGKRGVGKVLPEVFFFILV